MLKIVLLYFFIFSSTLTMGLWWARSHMSDVYITELHWTRNLGIQKCSQPDVDSRFLAAIEPDSQTISMVPCRWIWHEVLVTSGINTIPEWPTTDSLGIDERIILRTEMYSGILKPISLGGTYWRLSTSDVTIYMRFLEAQQANQTMPRVRATFGQVEGI
jgi:hypothetical protein